MSWRRKFVGLGLAAVLAGLAVAPPPASAQESTVESGKRKVKNRVVPVYPELARQLNVTGKVKIEIWVSPEGRVRSTHVIGGSPLLVNAALGAVKQWRFEPAAKETSEVVEFEFKRGD